MPLHSNGQYVEWIESIKTKTQKTCLLMVYIKMLLPKDYSFCLNKWSLTRAHRDLFFYMNTSYTQRETHTHSTDTHRHSQPSAAEKEPARTETQTEADSRLIQLRISSIIQHFAHRHCLKEGIKHARGPHLEITRTLPAFKMLCSEVKIDLGWYLLGFIWL